MASVAAPVPAIFGQRNRSRRILKAFFVVALAVIGAAIFLLIRFWPFAPARVIQSLQEVSDSQVKVRAFRHMYFPIPGCVLEGVAFTHDANASHPLITIERLTIRGTYLGLLRRHINLMNGEGMRVFIPPLGSGKPFHTQPSTLTIDEMVADNSILEIAFADPRKSPLRFDFDQASLHDVPPSGPFGYRIRVDIPQPPGELSASGKFGDWNQKNPPETPLSGEYKFEHADLGVYGGIAGRLSSSGKFGGKLGHVKISGTTDVPNFEVKSSGHAIPLTTEFSAFVNGTNGDVFLERVDARFGKTHVVAEGSIAGSENTKGKIALLHLSANEGRIENILGLFVRRNPPPMSGAVTLRAKVQIPGGPRPFLERVKLQGSFGIAGGEFSRPSTQEGVNKLSAGALGEKDPTDLETALTDLTGQVRLDNGTAEFGDVSFGIPGATARMHGTYNLIDYKIDLHGQMQLQSKISNTSTGAKALLLNMMEPFFKRRKKGEIVPVRISGTYKKPSFGLDPMDKKANVAPPTKPAPPRK